MDKLPPKSKEALHREATIARPNRSKPANLRDQVSNQVNWPTPQVDDSKNSGHNQERRQTLDAKVWASPRKSDFKGSGAFGSKSHKHMIDKQYLCAQVESPKNITKDRPKLNPDWVEWLMGWPIGHTDIRPMNEIIKEKLYGYIHSRTQKGTKAIQAHPLRIVRQLREEATASPSQGQKSLQQLARECPNIVYSMSWETTHNNKRIAVYNLWDKIYAETDKKGKALWKSCLFKGEWEAVSIKEVVLIWQSWSVDPADSREMERTTTIKTNRVSRLKAIGNGQVPQVVYAMEKILNRS
jgi:hypothetical protein